ncbi:MAG TPA: mannose-1-phosphate guanylyltransferase [Polyangiaceae bacterium]|nr:mannose-1-phosphate guanylyltransferase [Polyangiaceae bacterium]
MNSTYAVILAGGSGTRFWPASRTRHPKQLLALAGDRDESLIATTLARLAALVPIDQIYVATGKHLVEATKQQLPRLSPEAFLAEPVPRNTAPCIAWATRVIARRDPNATIVVVPSDHHIKDERSFGLAVETALRSANTDVITTIGIEPTRPETGYGYLELGAPVSDGVSQIARFVEKPNRPQAEAYLAAKRYLWNSGMFFFRAKTMNDAIARHLPDLRRGLDAIDDAARHGAAVERETLEQVFPTLPNISIDYGVLERESRLNVVRADFGWTDLGSFASVWENRNTDAQGNAAPPTSVLIDSERNLVFDARSTTATRTVAMLGVQDLCVVLTDDAVLVIPRERAQDVRLIVEQLKAAGRNDLL